MFADEGLIIEAGDNLEQMKVRMLEDNELEGILEIPGNLIEVDVFNYYSKQARISLFLRPCGCIREYGGFQRMKEAGFEPEQIQRLSALPGSGGGCLSKSGAAEENLHHYYHYFLFCCSI